MRYLQTMHSKIAAAFDNWLHDESGIYLSNLYLIAPET